VFHNPNQKAAWVRAMADTVIIDHPRLRHAHDQFEFLIEHGRLSGEAPKKGVLMIAPSQTGKSTILGQLVERMNTPEALERREIPALDVTLSANVTPRGLAVNILNAIEEKGWATGSQRGSEAVLVERAQTYIKAAGVQVLILDEFHHLVHSESKRLANSVGEMIKRMLIKGSCPIIMSGIDDARRPFEENIQLRQRCLPPIELKPLELTNPADLRLFTQFVADYGAALDDGGVMRGISKFLDSNLSIACVLEASRGVLGTACNLIKDAAQNAARQGRGSVLEEDFIAAGDEHMWKGLHDRNPFRDGLRALRPDRC
jgi:hypothetical protein